MQTESKTMDKSNSHITCEMHFPPYIRLKKIRRGRSGKLGGHKNSPFTCRELKFSSQLLGKLYKSTMIDEIVHATELTIFYPFL